MVVGQPFDLKVEPAELDLKAGDKAIVKIMALRKGGYKGPIALELRNLPANVTASKGIMAVDQENFELEIVAAPNAAPAAKKDVDVRGSATALNNLQNASPTFTVRVVKE